MDTGEKSTMNTWFADATISRAVIRVTWIALVAGAGVVPAACSEVSSSGESLGQTQSASSATVTLTPTKDSFVTDGSSASTNYGTSTYMALKEHGGTNSGYNRNDWLSFNISGYWGSPARSCSST